MSSERILGIDEAGRGPVIGPMVMVGALATKEKIEELKKIGVKDSKVLVPEIRRKLFKIIKRKVQFKKIVIPSSKIDEYVLHKNKKINLNLLEMENIAKLINYFKPDVAIVDCPSQNKEKFKNELLEKLIHKPKKLIVTHKADSKYVIVAAASILAKEFREDEIKKLKEKHNVDFGSGYPSDEVTMKFISKNFDKYDFIRKSWAPVKRLLDSKKEKTQKKLSDFFS